MTIIKNATIEDMSVIMCQIVSKRNSLVETSKVKYSEELNSLVEMFKEVIKS